MARDVRAPERMTRRELLAEVKRLRTGSTERAKSDGVIHDLRVYQEELATQRDQLMEIQRALEHSRDIYADLYDYAPLPYVTLDQYGIVRNINLTGAALLSVGRLALERTPFLRHVHHADRRSFLEHMRRCRMETGLIVTDLTLVVRGETVPVQITTRASMPPEERAVEYRTAIVDLRVLRAAEAARAHAERERGRLLREEERLRAAIETRDEFLAVLSHELRTPLTPILAIASVLCGRAEVPQPLREDLARIQRNIELETRLIDDLLDMTRAARGTLSLNRELLDLHELVRETVELCDADRPRGVAIRWSLAASEHHVHADPVRLRQVVWNLVRNAFQSIDAGGEVLLRSTNDAPGRVTLTVHDSGHGIDGGDLDRMFLPFYQPRGGGQRRLGLGLAISKSLVEAHKGRISARSAGQGRGASFEIELAVAAAAMAGRRTVAPVSALVPKIAESRPPSRLAVLLVEDNVDSADALSEALRLQGFEVRLTDSVAAAREAAREPFDVLVSDLALPDGSGVDLITELRRRGSVPAIALSGHGSELDKNRSTAAGFSAHLTKPVTIERLSEAIRGIASPASRQSG